MSITEWIVVVSGLLAIAWINWYFFLVPRRAPAAVVMSTSASTGMAAPGDEVA